MPTEAPSTFVTLLTITFLFLLPPLFSHPPVLFVHNSIECEINSFMNTPQNLLLPSSLYLLPTIYYPTIPFPLHLTLSTTTRITCNLFPNDIHSPQFILHFLCPSSPTTTLSLFHHNTCSTLYNPLSKNQSQAHSRASFSTTLFHCFITDHLRCVLFNGCPSISTFNTMMVSLS